MLHSQVKLPMMLVQLALTSHGGGFNSHSSMSILGEIREVFQVDTYIYNTAAVYGFYHKLSVTMSQIELLKPSQLLKLKVALALEQGLYPFPHICTCCSTSQCSQCYTHRPK